MISDIGYDRNRERYRRQTHEFNPTYLCGG